MSNQHFRLQLKSTHQESEKIPDFVSGLQAQSDLTEEETSTLMLLVSEAVSNAIEHGNQSDPSKTVYLDIKILSSRVVTTVTDEGTGFDYTALKNPLDEENLLDEGGRGIFLIRELAEDLTFLNGGRTVRFILDRS